MCTIGCCSQFCALLSMFGIFFLLSLGSMFHQQPFYTDEEIWHDGEEDDASNNCYVAGGIYACTLVLSLFGLWYDKRREQTNSSLVTTGGNHVGAIFGEAGLPPPPPEHFEAENNTSA
ncbi:unnamed protein product [Choristocarpus tenellus]